MIKNIYGLRVKYRYSYLILIKLAFSRPIFEKYTNIKFKENPSNESRVVSCVQTDFRVCKMKLIVAFHNFANVPKKLSSFDFLPTSLSFSVMC